MKARVTSQPPSAKGPANVTPLYPIAPSTADGPTPTKPLPENPGARAQRESAAYIAQMTLELERLAATADLELVAYFLAMARAEAEACLQPARGGD